MWKVVRACLGLTFLAACAGKTLTVGAGPVPASNGGTLAPGDVWTGYLEGFQLASGSDALTMTLTGVADDGTVTGTIRFGDLPLLAPPTDPKVGYPPGFTVTSSGAPDDPSDFVEHFDFAIRNGRLDGTRLMFTFDLFDVWGQWCALQQSYPGVALADGGTAYACAPGNGSFGFSGNPPVCSVEDESGNDVPIDCAKVALCGPEASVCTCSATGCSARSAIGGAFDMSIAGNKIDGNLVKFDNQPILVHFVKSS